MSGYQSEHPNVSADADLVNSNYASNISHNFTVSDVGLDSCEPNQHYSFDDAVILSLSPPNLDNTQTIQHGGGDPLYELLSNWGVEEIFNFFTDQKISIDVLKIMKRHQINNVLKDFSWGTIIMFEHKFENWRSSIGMPLAPENFPDSGSLNSNSNPTSPSSSYPNSPSPSLPSVALQLNKEIGCETRKENSTTNVTLSKILNETAKGSLLVDWYTRTSKFESQHRSMIISMIAQYFDDRKLPLKLSTTHSLEREIIERFPTEKLEFYRTGNRGKIYTKYCNMRTTLRTTFKNNIGKCPNSQNDKTVDKEELFADTDVESSIRSLKFDNLTAEQFDHVWQSCSLYRIKELKRLSTLDIFKKWPQYKTPTGFRLIDMDFSVSFGSNHISLDDWKMHIQLLLDLLLKDRIRDKAVKACLQDLQENVELTENTKNAAILWCLHGYLVPTEKSVTKDCNGRNNITKYTIKDSQDSFLYITNTFQQLQERMRFSMEKGLMIQPHIMAVGDNIFALKEFYVYSDGNIYKFNNFIRSVDICFKIFYLFNIEYPKSCISFWNFIEQYFYNFNSSNKKKFAKVEILKEDLKQLLN